MPIVTKRYLPTTKRELYNGAQIGDPMNTRLRLFLMFVAMWLSLAPLHSQERKFIKPANQVIAIRAGRLFDAKPCTLLNNQVVLIRGDRIADIGATVQIPREARVI